MKHFLPNSYLLRAIVTISLMILQIQAASEIGIFEATRQVGNPSKAGAVAYDAVTGTYKVSGGGENMWFTNDAFYFVFKKVTGDVMLTADIRLLPSQGNAHRKACLMVRQSLDSDAAYADAALHGDGLTSLQCREEKGGLTHEIQANMTGPKRLRIEKRGEYVSMWMASEGESLHPAGGAMRLTLADPFYVGLAVCAHDDKALEHAVFSKVELTEKLPAGKPILASTLEIVNIRSKDRRAIYWTTNRIEAPNWSGDGKFFYYNSLGRIWRLPSGGGEPQVLDTGFATRCNNDHGLSPDGSQMAISDQSQERVSIIYISPVTGGTPKRITRLGPSYWHGWSPDGKTLVYCAERDKEFDVYSIPASGGEEVRLTTAAGLDDGPEYSPDGRFIYFNSERSGSMQIWRMRPDGSSPEPVTADEYNNWFAHPSPDGKWLVFLSYAKEVQGHPENKDVMLRIMPVNGGKIEVLAKLFGGQGTINVPSWSPDSQKVAFVSYQWWVP